MDKLSPEERHYTMSRIRGKDTRPEVLVRKYLFGKGLRFRKNVRRLPGTPDIVLPKFKTVVFVNGCFWHGHEDCRYFILPSSNPEFWKAKIEKNQERDKRNQIALEALGWHVTNLWECELRTKALRKERLDDLYLEIIGQYRK
ncbi:MAG: DNA mismatch endonuclease Vsr [Spirochaetales bacterium]|nr:DNA mismatch endonuclease Vsr [Candidatus Physcosoma equi]